MARKNWEKIAEQEFKTMDAAAREQWAELRKRIH